MKVAWVTGNWGHDTLDVVTATNDARGVQNDGLEVIPWKILPEGGGARRSILSTLGAVVKGYDLVVLVTPWWITANGLSTEVRRILRHTPYVAGIIEHGAVREEWAHHVDWMPRIAVNNRHDLPWWRAHSPDASLYMLPHGSVVWRDDELEPDPFYVSDLIADGRPHYACGMLGGSKRECIDQMVLPVADLDLRVYGVPEEHLAACRWSAIEGIRYSGVYTPEHYRHVYPACRLYLGVTWNARFGGYSLKLARALSTGIPVLWPHTIGIEDDFGEPGGVLDWSKSAGETRDKVLWYLVHDEERAALGRRGRAWADEHLDWRKNLLRLAKEVAAHG